MSMKSAQSTRTHGRESEPQSTIADYLCRGKDQMAEMVEDQPTRSMLTCFAVGLGAGFCIGRMIAAPSKSAGYFDRKSAERLGNQLLERVEKAMPEAVRERLFS